jgi:hypothetical protein
MPRSNRMLLAAALSLAAAPLVAQTPNLSGHWEGSLQTPAMDIPFSIDVARNAEGQFAGTVNLPAEHIKGLPLLKVAVDGTSVSFYARTDQPLAGALSADGQTVTGDYFAGGATMPFSMTRKGEAHIEPPPASAAVAADLEGTWTGVIAASGGEVHVQLVLANTGPAEATAHLVNLDQGGLRIPMVVRRDQSAVTLTSTVVASGFTGTLNAAAGELTGTFTQGSLAVPATFRRSSAGR